MDAFELLKTDHKKVSGLFKQMESASNQAKEQLFAQLKSELDLHAHIEETIFYPALENTSEAREITMEAYEEHKVVKDLLAELQAGGMPMEEWDAKLKVLQENVEHHVEEEEGELFDKAGDALSADRIEALGDEMAAEKARASGQPATRSAAKNVRAVDSRASTKKRSVLGTLADMVGLGKSRTTKKRSSKPARKATTKKSAKATATKSRAAKKSSKSATTKRAASKKRTTKKAAPRKATKKAGAARGSKQASTRSRATALKRSRTSRKKTRGGR